MSPTLTCRSKDVIDANRNGTLGDFLGMSAQQLAQEMGKAPAATTNDQGAAGAGNKAPIGRICRMCRQVRAPVFGTIPCYMFRGSSCKLIAVTFVR